MEASTASVDDGVAVLCLSAVSVVHIQSFLGLVWNGWAGWRFIHLAAWCVSDPAGLPVDRGLSRRGLKIKLRL